MTSVKGNLREYQREGIRHLLRVPNAGLFYDPGLGKTITTLLGFILMQQRKGVKRMLVVAPLSVAKTVWQAEIERWDETRHLTHVLLHGPKKGQLLPRAKKVDISIINYEGLAWLEKTANLHRWPWDVIVYDEVSKMKDTSTRRHGMVRRMWDNFDRHIGLTGTPAPNSMMELFGQMRVIDGGVSLGKGIDLYRQTYFYKPFPQSYDYELRKGAAEIISQRITPAVHRLSAKDHLNMPDRIDVWHDLPMPETLRPIYEEMENEMIIEFANSKQEVTAMTAGVLWGKLQQITQGFVYSTGDAIRDAIELDNSKLGALDDIVEEAMGQPLLVMYKFREDLHRLHQRFPQAAILTRDNTTEIVQKWNDRQLPILFANPQSAGHGLNLQRGGHILVYYALESSNERYIQANGRLHRQGQENTVIIHHLNMKGTVDDDIREVLAGRETMQQKLLARLSALQAARAS